MSPRESTSLSSSLPCSLYNALASKSQSLATLLLPDIKLDCWEKSKDVFSIEDKTFGPESLQAATEGLSLWGFVCNELGASGDAVTECLRGMVAVAQGDFQVLLGLSVVKEDERMMEMVRGLMNGTQGMVEDRLIPGSPEPVTPRALESEASSAPFVPRNLDHVDITFDIDGVEYVPLCEQLKVNNGRLFIEDLTAEKG